MVVKCIRRGTMDVTQGRSKEKMNVSLRSKNHAQKMHKISQLCENINEKQGFP
jgi:hypothetical protein